MPSPVSLDKLRRNRAYVLILAFAVSTIIEALVHRHAAPDLVWMSIMAISIYLLFEVGLFFAQFFVKR
jgi:Sec-independent protein secretion pathway component TatC